MPLPNWLSWLRPAPASEPAKNNDERFAWDANDSTQLGIVKNGSNLEICLPQSRKRGVKLVTVNGEFMNRYNRAYKEWTAVQLQLAALPKSLRPRKRSVRGSTTQEKANEPQ